MTRLLSALVLAAPVLAIVFFAPSVVFLCLTLVLVFRAGWEFQGLIGLCGWRVGVWEGALDACAFALAVWVGGVFPALVFGVVILRVLAKTLLGESGLFPAGLWLLGVAWVGGAGGLLALVRDFPGGREAVFFLFAVVWANDVAAMYVGKAWGRRKLAPRISPGKTMEGAVGGVLAGVIAGVLTVNWAGVPGVDADLAAPLALALGLCALAGDLGESVLKRAAGAKDASAIIPGHGGVLDRIDGLLVAGPAFYGYLYLTGTL